MSKDMRENTFINFTNHPSSKWSAMQTGAAKEYGEIVDVPFPEVDPAATAEDIRLLAEEYVRIIMENRPAAVLCQGEFNLCYAVISMLREEGITVLAACSSRVAEETPEGKISRFEFRQFRKYEA